MIAIPRSGAIRRIAAALLVTTALTMAQTALASSVPVDPFEVFANSGYTYCDATLVAALWKIDVTQAKAEIGQKIVNGLAANIPPLLADARRVATCSWADTPHTYDDAERLAAYWQMPEPYDAKTKVAELYTAGRSDIVLAALAAAPASGVSQNGDAADFEAFAQSQYTYCDAKLVGALWQISIDEGKTAIGYKLRNGYGDLIPPILVESRQTNRCEWTDTPYIYDDAVKLAKVWGVPVDAAKLKVAAYYTNGESAVVERALGRG